MNQENRNILFDANALIDFQKTDFSVLGEVRQHLGNLYLLKEIRDEVQGLTKRRLSLGQPECNFIKGIILKSIANQTLMVAFHCQIDLICIHQLIQDIVW